jgi:hypothetical protein
MTIIGSLPREEEAQPPAVDVEEAGPAAEAEPDPEPQPDEEPELPPAAEAEGARRWWQRKRESDRSEAAEPDEELPRHVRVLPAPDLQEGSDPWEQGFDAGEEPDLLHEEAPGRSAPR